MLTTWQMPQGHSPPPSNANPSNQYQHRLSASSAADSMKRSSLPPGFRMGMSQQKPSPLARALTPPSAEYLASGTEPFPSVENLESAGSGSNFHISGSGLPSNSASSNDQTSPLMRHHHSTGSSFGSKADTLEIYCASCSRPWKLRDAFACTECISALCSSCVGAIISSPMMREPGQPSYRRGCPKCGVMSQRFKRFNLDFR